MIKKIITVLACTLLFAPAAKADNKEEIVRLDNLNNKTRTILMDYAAVKFQVLSFYNDTAEVSITVDNMALSETVLLFRESRDERGLRKPKPKIVFVETYGGEKGSRFVLGCRELRSNRSLIRPSSSEELFRVNVSTSQPTELVIPFYLAKYTPKKFLKSARYSILREDMIKFVIEVKGWSKDDPQFVDVKKAVTEFQESLTEKMFCNHERHDPPLQKQQEPYIQKRDSLIGVIDNIILANRWMSDQTPHIEYSALRTRLEEIDLDQYAADCGAHKRTNSHGYCSLCQLSAKQLFERLDGTYQQLHIGMIDKQNAVKTAKAIYNCYRQSLYRKKDRLIGEKITDYYNRIINF